MNPTWDDIWMDFAHSIARRSYDPRFQVGSVVVTEDNTQVFALLKMDYNNPKKKKLYLTLSPCRMCAKAIVNAGINEVIFKEEYRDLSSLKILDHADVKWRKV